jgi:SAM domain (Sterile alpha motif)
MPNSIIPELFTAHEIDVGLFMTMREVDLVNLGVDRFGPRRKMMALIAGNFILDGFQKY